MATLEMGYFTVRSTALQFIGYAYSNVDYPVTCSLDRLAIREAGQHHGQLPVNMRRRQVVCLTCLPGSLVGDIRLLVLEWVSIS